MPTTKLTGTFIRSGSIPVVALGGGVISSSVQLTNTLPVGTVSSSTQIDYNAITNKLSGVVSSSAQVQPLLPNGTISSSAQYPGWVTASSQIDYNNITNKLSGVVSSSAQVAPLLPAGTLSSSTQVNAILDADGVLSSSAQVVVQNTTGIGALATTGSNVFNANQTITGSLFISQNLVVQGSSSVSYISQSTLNIGTNKITVNSDAPAVRFGGLDVIDSGSSPQRSGSLYFDSLNDQWIFVHQNTAGGITSSVILMGPPTFNNIGNETLLTQNRVLKGAGLEHITDSQITDNGVTVTVTNGLSVGTNLTASQADITTLRATSITASVSGAHTGTFPYASLTGLPTLVSASSQIDYNSITNKLSGVYSSSTQIAANLPAGTVSSSAQTVANIAGQTIAPAVINATGAISGASIQTSGNGIVLGNIGIGTSTPSASLHVSGTMMVQGVIERANITGSAPPTTLNVDAISGSVFYLSGSSANNWTVNFRGSAATSLNSMMYNGQSMTFAVLVNHASVGYTASAHQVDGVSITPRWQGGTVPSGSGTSTDIYSYTIIKLASASYNMFASQTKFA